MIINKILFIYIFKIDFTLITVKNVIYVEYPYDIIHSKVYPDILYVQSNTGKLSIIRINYDNLEFSYVSDLPL